MELSDILDKYAASPQMRHFNSVLAQPERSRVFLKDMCGSLPGIFAAAWCRGSGQRAVFVLPDREEAAYFLNDLENLLGERNALFFPSSLKKPYGFPVVDNGNVLLRAEVLTHLGKNVKPLPVVTYAEAFHEKVVTRKALAGNTVEARVGEALSVDFLMDFLNENEFQRTDFVYEAGQYSIRGGIVDIFSFANEFPYRVEFDGDSIGSIRSFDPATQLSEKNMNHITIIPNLQGKLMKDERQSFAAFLPDDTVLWFKDLTMSLEVMQAGLKKMDEMSKQSPSTEDDLELMSGTPDEAFDEPNRVSELLNKFRVVEHASRPHFSNALTILFNSRPQPSFNKNFQLLGETFLSQEKAGIKNIIFADTAKQIERLYAIFRDISFPGRQSGQEIPFTPILLSLHEGFIDQDLKLACFTDHQVFDRYHRYRVRRNYNRNEALTLKEIYSLKPGDFVTHIDHGIGKFAGLEKLDVNGKKQEAIRLVYKDNDILYVSIHSLHRIARYSGKEGTQPKLNKLGSTAWATLKQKTKKKVKDIARELIALYAQRRAQKGFAFQKDTYLQNELEASFIYEDTPDQVKSTADVKRDMEKPYPMDRLICGDVGFGKTEIAIRAAFKAVTDGKQVAVLVPTTILALQHYKTFRERLKDFPCTVDYLNRFKSTAQQSETLRKLKEGKIDIIIGTHRLLSKDIEFSNLGLMVIDEEQKFGVAAKEKLKALRVNVDSLTLTATPIPRTLQFSLMGARDLSIINTPPPNRYPVTTEVHTFDEKLIRDAVNYEVSRGGQVFFIHNRVQDIHDISALIRKLCPDVTIGVGHGQMDGPQLEQVLVDFIEGETDVLVSTTIVESGIDISNANTMIINQAHHFGLSDLHQMRGRVGRSNKKAFCYLLSPPLSVLTPEARQRLKAIEEFSDLGSGFNVAMRDLDIRGAGNLLGGEQSGFISEIGYEMYHKILDEAIQELRETDFKDLFPAEEHQHHFSGDCQIDTDLEILIPSDYISSVTERLNIYKEIDDLEREDQLVTYMKNLRDRFGPVPMPVEELFNALRLRWKAKQLGFEKIALRGGVLKGFFISNPESPFYRSPLFGELISYIQSNPHRIKLSEKQNRLSISFTGVRSVEQANRLFDDMSAKVSARSTSQV